MSRMDHVRMVVRLSIALSTAAAALAARVDLYLTVTEQPDSSSIWTLEASTSAGDNDGLAGYNIDVVGNGVVGHHESPLSTAAGIPLRGFTVGGDDIPPGALFAAQDSTDPSSVYYGVGSPDLGSRIPDPNVAPGLDHRQVPWPMPVLLAAGTADDLNSVNFGPSIDVNVWEYGEAAIGGTAAEAVIWIGFYATYVRFPVTIYVDDDAPGDPMPGDPTGSDPLEDGSAAHPFDAIQEAIDAALAEDTVEIADGTYTGSGNRNLFFLGKAITVRSASGDPDTCIVDCEDSSNGFYFVDDEGADSVLEGLTIANGHFYEDIYSGAGVCIWDSSPTLNNCTIRGSSIGGTSIGAGVICIRSNAVLNNCRIIDNVAGFEGGGVAFHDSNATLMYCTISGNTAGQAGGGVDFRSNDTSTLIDCLISGNSAVVGGGVRCDLDASPTLVNCTISGNTVDDAAGAIHCLSSHPTLTNCVLWGNDLEEVYVDPNSSVTATYCDIEGGSGQPWFGIGCIDADPAFVDADGPDDDPNTWEDNSYRLLTGSPCVDAGDPNHVPQPGETDLDGADRVVDGDNDSAVVVDMGAYEFQYLGPRTWYVDDDAAGDPAPGDPSSSDPLEDGSAAHPFDAIQEGIDAAIVGDTVEIADGTYTGDGNRDLDFGGKAITVRSASGDPSMCIIDCQGDPNEPHRGFYFNGGEGPDSIVEGLTITGGYHTSGAGVYCYYSNPLLTHCTISGNAADYGGGIHCSHSSPRLTHCTISGNAAVAGGGADCIESSNPTLVNCTVSENSASSIGAGVFCSVSADVTLTNCVITGNATEQDGGGLFCDRASPSLANCVISGNSAASLGAAVYCTQGSPSLTNCTISGNSASSGGALFCVGSSSSPTFTNCILWGDSPQEIHLTTGSVTATYCDIRSGWSGSGNIDADPRFIRAPSPGFDGLWDGVNDDYGDLHLRDISPCINTGDPNFPYDPNDPNQIDIDGDERVLHDRVDIGADETSDFADCNINGIPDSEDISDNPSLDCNGNWELDECEVELTEVTKLLAVGGMEDDRFGYNGVAIDGTVAVVGAYLRDDQPDDNAGAAHVFRYTDGSWQQEAELLASDAAPGDYFGYSVDVSGDRVVIGAHYADNFGGNSGAAYVYRYDPEPPAAWIQEAELLPDVGAGNDWFGISVAIQGDVIIVGAQGDDDVASAAGAAYIFRRSGSTWTQEAKLVAADGESGDTFGEDVAIDGDVVLVGASRSGDYGQWSGSAYVFRYSGTWTQEAKLLASDGAGSDFFGHRVSVSGDVVVIGAHYNDEAAVNAGAAYVFRHDGMSWNEEQKLLAADIGTNEWFGYDVAVAGDTVLVGAYHDNDLGRFAGSAYVFEYTGQAWTQVTKILASDGAAEDYFGRCVDLSGDLAILGAWGDDDNGDGSGAAYIYKVPVADCNGNGIPDACESFDDCNANGVPDECELYGHDCNGNGIPDECDIAADPGLDNNGNGVPDACEGPVRYVDDDALLGGTGISWESPYRDLQEALAAATADPNVVEVRVAGGVYRPSAQTDPNDPRTATFAMLDGVALQGGYAGLVDPNAPDTRDPVAYLAVLSGDLAANDDPNAPVDPNAFAWQDNAYHVVTASGVNADAVLDGFTVTAGNANHVDDSPRRRGGGLYKTSGTPTISHCIFSSNNAALQGGGMYSRTGDEQVSYCQFVDNSSESGGGFYNAADAASLLDCTFTDNSASDGGGAYVNSGDPTLTRCMFESNTATVSGGGFYQRNSAPVLANCLFQDNYAASGGGVMARSSTALLVNCLFNGNQGNLGGGMYQGEDAAIVVNCTFTYNFATSHGGALYNSQGATVLTSCVLWGNTAPNYPQVRGAVTITYSCIEGGGFAGVGNIVDDPLLQGDAWHLEPNSPCINAGDPNSLFDPNDPNETDLDGEPRVQQCRVDMGADETGSIGADCNTNGVADACDIEFGASTDTNGNGIPDECEGVITGDIDGDGDVDADDFALLVGCMSGPGNANPGCDPEHFERSDIDGDGDVDMADFAEFQAAFGT